MTEKGGGVITDIAGGVVLTPVSMSPTVPEAVRLVVGSGFPTAPGSGSAATLGSFPAIGTKSFILFGVQKLSSDTARANTYFGFKDVDETYIGVFDGDGGMVSLSDGTYVSGQESYAGQDGFTSEDGIPRFTSNAIIRDGNALGNFVMPSYVAHPENQGNTVGTGDVYQKFSRNAGFNDTYPPGTYGNWSRNDYSIPTSIVQDWQDKANGGVPISTWPEGGLTFGNGGLPGVWSYIDPAYSVKTPTKFTACSGLVASNDFFGVALFVFDNGLPADFKEALRWMNYQWIAGNKVIWPGWNDL